MSFDIHQYLKNNTQELHTDMEKLYLPNQLIHEKITHQEYLQYLVTLLCIHTLIEKSLTSFEQWQFFGIEIDKYLRRNLLLQDISIMSDGKLQANVVSICDLGPNEISFEMAIGYLYVLTGSTMGGQLLSKKVCSTFKNTQYAHANNYFSAFQEQTFPRWFHFLGALQKYATNENKQAILDGARACYEEIKKGFDGN